MRPVIDFLLNHWYVVGPLLLLSAAFVKWFFLPALVVDRNLQQMRSALSVLRRDNSIEPRAVKIADPELSRLWSQYCDTLQIEVQPDWKSLFEGAESHRSTMPAEVIFCGASIIDGRLHVEFFKHLPGLMTGLGIIGTFGGLIDGLGAANIGGVLKTEVLIASVREAFFVSASAIVAAMLVTFFEKFHYARLHRRLSDLCRRIDGLWVSAMSDDLTPRLVRASEQAAASMGQLNDNLVGELRDFLLRLVERQKELGERQEMRLQQLLATLQQQKSPDESKTRRPERPSRPVVVEQGETFNADALREQLGEFADKIAHVLGGQLALAREAQSEIVKSLEAASLSSKDLAQGVADASERAIAAVSEQMTSALCGITERQDQLIGAMRELIDELRAQGEAFARELAMKEAAEKEAAEKRPVLELPVMNQHVPEQPAMSEAMMTELVKQVAVKERREPESRRLSTGAVLNLAETLAQLHPMRAAE
jgi:hypothetical protein